MGSKKKEMNPETSTKPCTGRPQKTKRATRSELRDCRQIIDNIAECIQYGYSIQNEEKSSLENPKPCFKAAMTEWKEEETDLNLLQLATMYGRTEIVDKLKNTFVFSCKGARFVVNLTVTKGAKERKKTIKKTFIYNSSFHLACKMGHIKLVQLFLASKIKYNSRKTFDVLEERSTVDLEKAMEVHRELFRHRCSGHTSIVRRAEEEMDSSEIAANYAKLGINFGGKRRGTDHLETNQFLSALSSLKTGIEISAEAGHVECCMFLADLILQKRSKVVNSESMQVLHKACYLQLPDYLQLLLRDQRHRSTINTLDPSGKHPLLIALKNKKCVQILLENGADPNHVTYRNKSLLQWLITEYSDLDKCVFKADCNGTRITDSILHTGQLLLKHGANVNYWEEQSSCSNSMCKSNKKRGRKLYRTKTVLEEILNYYVKSEEILVPGTFLNDFIALLLDFGAETVINRQRNICAECAAKNTGKGRGNALFYCDRTIAHTFMKTLLDYYDVTDVCNANNHVYIYTILRHLFEQGCLDSNVLPLNKCNILQLFMSDILNGLAPTVQRSFLHLLFNNGADFNSIPKPNVSYKNHRLCRGFDFYLLPLNRAFAKRFHMDVLENILQFMNTAAIQKSFRHLQIYKDGDREQEMKTLVRKYTVRTLCHLCKLVIMVLIGKQGRVKIQHLFIPEILKMYLSSNVF